MEIFEFVESNLNNLLDVECRERNIGKFNLGDTNSDKFLIIRLEREGGNEETICDCIIISLFNENHLFAISIVELKSPSHSFRHAKRQLDSCIKFLKEKIFHKPENKNLLITLNWDFFPIIVSKSFPNRISNRAILSPANRINFIGNRKSRIVLKAKYQGDNLKTIILNKFRHT